MKFIPLLVFFWTFGISAYFATMGISIEDDGNLLKAALDVSRGKQLFKEAFTQYGALTTLIQALSIKIFGEYLLTIRILTAFFYGLSALTLYYVWKTFTGFKIALLGAFLFPLLASFLVVPLVPWSSVYALFFQSLASLLLIRFIQTKFDNNIYVFLLGVLSSLTFWVRQPVGIFLFIAFAVFFVSLKFLKILAWQQTVRYLALITAGFFIVSLVFLVWLLITDSLRDWWLQSFVLAFNFGKIYGEEYNPASIIKALFVISHEKILSSYTFFRLIPATILFYFGYSFYKLFKGRREEKTIVLFGVTIVLLASWMQYYPTPEILHLFWAAIPALGLYLYFMLNLKKFIKQTIIYTVLILLFLAPLFYTLSARIYRGVQKASEPYEETYKISVLSGIKLVPSKKTYFEDVKEAIDGYLKKYPERRFITRGTGALYLTFTEKSANPHVIYMDWGAFTRSAYPNYDKEVSSYIKEEKPLILLREDFKIPDGYRETAFFREYRTILAAPIQDSPLLQAPER